ncbi:MULTISPECIES: type II toxin-antitoxin system PemK/MazF family toxin [Chelativorans]|uniref:type II toxin-antitoxin system PemK/MazF family toxin n=1 Tax=Chelativorans TaxID=449972 RepID=UPI000A004E33
MGITFAPKRGAILMCDFDRACVPPEMDKFRQVLVVSKNEFNYRHARLAGTCVVVPFTTKAPRTAGPEDIFFPVGSYWSLTENSWLRGKLICTVSHDRLDLVLRNGRRHPSEFMKSADLERVEVALRDCLGLG